MWWLCSRSKALVAGPLKKELFLRLLLLYLKPRHKLLRSDIESSNIKMLHCSMLKKFTSINDLKIFSVFYEMQKMKYHFKIKNFNFFSSKKSIFTPAFPVLWREEKRGWIRAVKRRFKLKIAFQQQAEFMTKGLVCMQLSMKKNFIFLQVYNLLRLLEKKIWSWNYYFLKNIMFYFLCIFVLNSEH